MVYFQEKYMSGMATVMFGAVSLGPALLALLLPDASRAALPDDVAAAENIDKRDDTADDQCVGGNTTSPEKTASP